MRVRAVSLLVLALALVACGGQASGGGRRPTPAGGERARVVRVVDGDTVVVDRGRGPERLRYIGMNAPELHVATGGPADCFATAASERNRSLVDGREVVLERDVSETDRYGRLLRYVWVDGTMAGETLVREGYAHAATFPPDVRYQDRLRAAEREARSRDAGLWSACRATPARGSPTSPHTSSSTPVRSAIALETASPRPTTSPPLGGQVCDFSGTDRPLIKGNINAKGERIYHVPGGAFYERTVIDESQGERWFCTEAEATAAGWRRSLR